MKKAKRDLLDAAELRRLAEHRLREQPPLVHSDVLGDMQRLVQELETHQVELQIQNEELRETRTEVEHMLERYTELFDFAPVGYAILTFDGRIREINHAGARVFEQPRAHLIGIAFRTLIAYADRNALGEMIGQAFATQSKQACEIASPRVGAAPLALSLSATILPRTEPLVLLAFQDVSEEREKGVKLERAERTLREANHRKDEFLAVLSHELRNPLAPVRNSLHVLAHAPPGGEQARKAERIIERQVTHLTRLIDDLLDVTRIARGKVHLRREPTELGELVRRTIDDHRTSFESNGIRIEARLSEGLFWVDADPSRLVQALSNLLGNAEKFTPRGGGVVISLRHEKKLAVLRVRDSGRGIDRDEVHHADGLRHLFEPFVQVEQSMARAHGGLGLGLAMVKGLVELHGGTVGITSEGLGRGTEVSIVLPLIAVPASSRAVAPDAVRRSRNVLVIEDNPDSAVSLHDALELAGHDVQIAYDGTTGLALVRESRPDVVICDIGLPGLDGFAVARAIRADRLLDDTYLIALSGYAQPEDLTRATEAGFDCRLAKPADMEQLDRLLSDLPH